MTSEYMWVYSPKPAKLNKVEKTLLLDKVSYIVRKSSKLNVMVNRIEIKAGRVYLYNLTEQYGWI